MKKLPKISALLLDNRRRDQKPTERERKKKVFIESFWFLTQKDRPANEDNNYVCWGSLGITSNKLQSAFILKKRILK